MYEVTMYDVQLVSYNNKGAIGIDLDNSRWFMGCLIVPSEPADVVCAVEDSLFYLVEEPGCRVSADVGTRRNQRSFELCAQGLAEQLVGDPDADTAVLCDQVRCQVPRVGVDDGHRFGLADV